MANYEIDILVNGKPIKQFRYKGDYFVEGRKGSTFELKVTNNTWNRIEVVTSVDGLSVIDGEECGVESSGYLVNARDSITIPGWRLNDDTVAEFIFKDKKKSYSSQSGKGTINVGAIGFMVFVEKEYIHPYVLQQNPWVTETYTWGSPYLGSPVANPWIVREHSVGKAHNTSIPLDSNSKKTKTTKTSDTDNSKSITNTVDILGSNNIQCSNTVFDSARTSISNDASVFNIGVGFGDEQDHSVTEVSFQRSVPSRPTDTLVIYYDSLQGLKNRGIRMVRTKKKKSYALPNAFPTYSSGSGCKPPPDWKSRK